MKIRDQLAEHDEEMIVAEGLDEAIIGVGYRQGQPDLVVYDIDKVLTILMTRDELSYEEAREYFEYNIGGSWMGERTPVWMENWSHDHVALS